MAELVNSSTAGDKKSGRVTRKKTSTRVDLTAMVDLAFLLITFFILTTTLQKPTAMDLIMPVKGPSSPIPASRTLTLLLGSNNKLEWYIGLPDNPITAPAIDNYGKSIRKILLEQGAKIKQAHGKDMIVLIKPSDKSNYNNLISVMDELNIVNNQMRSVVDITPNEVGLLKRDGLYN